MRAPFPLRSSLSRSFALVMIFAMWGIGIPAIAEDDQIGFVFDVSGDWTLKGRAGPLQLGQSVPAGGVVVAVKPNDPNAHISIVYLDGKLESRSCDAFEACRAPIKLKGNVEQRSAFVTRLIDVMINAFERNPQLYAPTNVRNRPIPIRDAVVEFVEGALDLRSAFSGAPPGEYSFFLHPLRADGKSDADDEWPAGTYRSDGPRATRIAPPVVPGLYEVWSRFQSGDLDHVQPSDHWILVADPRCFAEASKQFEEGVELTKKWPKESEDEITRFRHIHLGHLLDECKARIAESDRNADAKR